MTTTNEPRRPWWRRLACALGLTRSPEEQALRDEIKRGETKRRNRAAGRTAKRIDNWKHAGAVLALALLLALQGCAALKAIGPMLAEYGIAKAEELAAGGRDAINKARERAESIPDAIERNTALLECIRAEQIYQTTMLEWLTADEQADGDPPETAPSETNPKP